MCCCEMQTSRICFCSYFVGELEKCLDDHEYLAELFIKHVSICFVKNTQQTA